MTNYEYITSMNVNDLASLLSCVYNDRDDFEDALSDYLAGCEEYENLSDEEFNTLLTEELSKYEPYWKKVIAITGNN